MQQQPAAQFADRIVGTMKCGSGGNVDNNEVVTDSVVTN